MNLGWISDAFEFLASRLIFRPLSSRVALAGLPRVFSRPRVSESHATDERGDAELEGSLFGRGDTEFLFCSVLEIRSAVAAPHRAYCDRLDLSYFLSEVRSALLTLPLHSPDSLALRAANGLFDPLGFASLGGCLPLTVSLRESTTRAFSGYRAVLGARLLDILVIYLVFYKSARRLFPPVEWNGMERGWRV